MIKTINAKIPAKSRLQIAEEYDINYKTLCRRLKKHHIILPTGLVYPKEQQIIYSTLGYPSVKIKRLFVYSY